MYKTRSLELGQLRPTTLNKEVIMIYLVRILQPIREEKNLAKNRIASRNVEDFPPTETKALMHG